MNSDTSIVNDCLSLLASRGRTDLQHISSQSLARSMYDLYSNLLPAVSKLFEFTILNPHYPHHYHYYRYGLQNMRVDSSALLKLIDVIATLIEVSDDCYLDEEEITVPIFFGIQQLDDKHTSTRRLLRAIISKLLKRLDDGHRVFSSSEIAHGLYGLQSMYAYSQELQSTLSVFAEALARAEVYHSVDHVAMMMYGLQGVSSRHEEMKSILKSLASAVRHLSTGVSDELSAQNISMLLHGFRNCESEDKEVIYHKFCPILVVFV